MLNEINRLNKVLDEDPFLIYLALADLYEEEKNLIMSFGYRWLALYRKYPVMVEGQACWGRFWNSWDSNSKDQNTLPRQAFLSMMVAKGINVRFLRPHTIYYPSVSESIWVAAEHLGRTQ